MKKMQILFVLVPLLAFLSCGKNGTPETVAEQFVRALYTADFDGAKKHCTEESKQIIDLVASISADQVETMKNAKIEVQHGEVTIAEDGNSADVELIITGAIDDDDNTDKTEKIHLVKENNKWLVEYKFK